MAAQVFFEVTHVGNELLAAVRLDKGASRQKPLNVTFLVDTSSSMVTQNRLEVIKDALKDLVVHKDFLDLLEPVRFKNPMIQSAAVVSFNSVAKTVAPAFCTLRKYLESIDSLKPEGDTNFGAAFGEAYKHVRDQRGIPRLVVLFSDGKNDQEYCINGAFRDVNFVLYSIGIGQDNDVEFLKTVASEKGGQFAFVRVPRQIQAALDCVVTHAMRLGLFTGKITSSAGAVNVRHMCLGTSFYALVKETSQPLVLQFYDQQGQYCELDPTETGFSDAALVKVEELKMQGETIDAISAALRAAKKSRFEAAKEILSDAGSALAEFAASHPTTQLNQLQTALEVVTKELENDDTFARSALGGASYSAYQSLLSQSDFNFDRKRKRED